MKTSRLEINSVSFFIFIIIAVLVLVGQSQAYNIEIDPPTGWWTELDIPFDSLNGTAVSGQSLSLDFLFPDQKVIGARDLSSDKTVALLMLQTDYIGGYIDDKLSGTGFMLDKSGNPLSAPLALLGGGSNNGGELFAFLLSGDHIGDWIEFYGVHYELTLPIMPGTEVIAAQMRFCNFSYRFPLSVGVPEPATMLLLGLGLIGLAGVRRKLNKYKSYFQN